MATDVILNTALAFVFITAASWLAARINYSSIPFLILAGMLVGPHAPEFGSVSLKIITDNGSIELLSRLGVLLMLFYLGLEFSAGKLADAGKNLFKGGVFYVLLNFARGLGFGWLFFRSWSEALVVAGITAVSSSAIITKLLVDLKRTANPETELILGIMVFEDVFIAVYLSVLSGILAAGALHIPQMAAGIFLMLAFIGSIIVFGRRLGAFLENRLKFKNSEVFVVAIFTLLLLAGVLAEKLHIAEAIGALLLGLVMAETTHNHRIVQMITPMRDLFGAVFFFAFGMAIDHRVFGEVAAMAAAAVLITVLGNIITGLIASWLSGYRKRRAVNVAFTIIARGEFSVIVAGFAASSGLSSSLPAFAALYVLVLALISPVLARNTRLFYETFEKAVRLFKKAPART
ncbi:MAG: cation:proton antiporter [Peptococcaceae bacterium]|nr:cation:proton antiporter [Peptococcaceae bacterium]